MEKTFLRASLFLLSISIPGRFCYVAYDILNVFVVGDSVVIVDDGVAIVVFICAGSLCSPA